ncbi:MAG: NAD(P)/FAD-dependent oxidoreductase [Mariniblastus sp.]
MRIAIIGGGISGLVAGYHLHRTHDVTLFEANDYIGGHTNTVEAESGGQTFLVDTGFIVFNDRTYPNFIKLLDELGVASQETRMSFSVSCARTGLEYRGADPGGLFAQRKNLVSPRFLRLLWDLVRFNRLGQKLLESDAPDETVDEFFARHRFSDQFIHQYFLPMGAAIWSAPFEKFRKFPIKFIAEFYKNHGLLGVTDRPQWRVITGGSKQYVPPLIEAWKSNIKLNSPVCSIERENENVQIRLKNNSEGNGQVHEFDHVIFACHSDQALAILGNGASPNEREILSAFPYEPNLAILHKQESVLPKNRRAWACWNYYNPVSESKSATVTYNMNMLQSLNAPDVFCVTLNDEERIRPENIIKSFNYSHPTFNIHRSEMQQRQSEMIDSNLTSFCGAYWGNGFHEDGVKSALAVVESLNTSQSPEVSGAL